MRKILMGLKHSMIAHIRYSPAPITAAGSRSRSIPDCSCTSKRTNLIAQAEISIASIEDATSRLDFAESRSLLTESNKEVALCELCVDIRQLLHHHRDIRSTLRVSRDLDQRLEACQRALVAEASRLEEMEGKGDAEEAREGRRRFLGRGERRTRPTPRNPRRRRCTWSERAYQTPR